MFRIPIVSVAFCMVFSHCILAASSEPPRALFGFGTSYQDANQKYGLSCSNNAIKIDESIESVEYQSSKAEKTFTQLTKTPHGEAVVITCNSNKNYYENITSKPSYIITCDSGTWKNVSLCVRKCSFTKDEFKVNDIVKGKDVSNETSAAQFKVVAFETATAPSQYSNVQKSGSTYYVNVGDSVQITCPSTHPPFTSNSADMKYVNIDTNSFITQCKLSDEKGKNKWSNYAACYNGYKPCNNSEITVKVEGQDIYTDNGEHFKEFGGEKASPTGRTLHGAKLQLACNKYPWYKKYDYKAPTCRDGNWTSTEAYCKAYSCTVKEMFNGASIVDGGVVADSINSVADDADKKIYYDQTHIFKCKHSNRVGGLDGKALKCTWNASDALEVKKMTQYATNWYERYCTTKCQVDQFSTLHSVMPQLPYAIDGFYPYFGNGESVTNTVTYENRKEHTTSTRGLGLGWVAGCDGGYEKYCSDRDLFGTCTKYRCRKLWTDCEYTPTTYSCSGSTVSSYASSTQTKEYSGWGSFCTKSGMTEVDLLDQSYKSVEPTSGQRIQCNPDGCYTFNP
jgi:hypothetical protein